jgi:hypothetical protein
MRYMSVLWAVHFTTSLGVYERCLGVENLGLDVFIKHFKNLRGNAALGYVYSDFCAGVLWAYSIQYNLLHLESMWPFFS